MQLLKAFQSSSSAFRRHSACVNADICIVIVYSIYEKQGNSNIQYIEEGVKKLPVLSHKKLCCFFKNMYAYCYQSKNKKAKMQTVMNKYT